MCSRPVARLLWCAPSERKGCGSTLGQQELVTACERVWERKSCPAVATVHSGQWHWVPLGRRPVLLGHANMLGFEFENS